MHPDFNGQEIDVFGCGNTFGSLIAFLTQKEKNFRFTAEKIGSTLFLIRKENTPEDIIDNVYGYGHTFPEVYTDWGEACVGSESHQRLVSYSLGGIKCIIRSETDGYLPQKLDEDHHLRQKRAAENHEQDGDDRILHIPSISSTTRNPKASSSATGLSVRRAGEIVPQSAIFDLKTRSSRSKPDMEEYINQTSNFILACHNRGIFNHIQIQDVRGSVKNWEDRNEALLGHLKKALAVLDAVVEKQSGGRVEVRRVTSARTCQVIFW